MASDRPPRARLPRRGFLGALALAPAALAACKAASAAGATGGAAAPREGPVSRAPAPDAAVRAVRELPLGPDAEPAFVFRAGAARPGEP